MMMIGLESLESLHRCRQVCKTWNEMILRDIWESQSKKKILKKRIEENWGPGMLPSDEEIAHSKWLGDGCLLFKFIASVILSLILEARAILDTDKIERLSERVKNVFKDEYFNIEKNMEKFICGASLAHHGLLDSLEIFELRGVDLSPFPTQHLASLVSCVTSKLHIENIRGCDLVSLLTSLKCKQLGIWRQSLGREETRALVQAMESGVEEVFLFTGVTLDIEALVEYEYSRQGVCRCVGIVGVDDTKDRDREELRKWASRKNWRVGSDDVGILIINKK